MPKFYCRQCRKSWQADAYPTSTGPLGCPNCPNAYLFALDTSPASAAFWNGGQPRPVNVRPSITDKDAFALADAWGVTKGVVLHGGKLLDLQSGAPVADLQNVVALSDLTYRRFLLPNQQIRLGDYLLDVMNEQTPVTLVATWKDPNCTGNVAGLARNRR